MVRAEGNMLPTSDDFFSEDEGDEGQEETARCIIGAVDEVMAGSFGREWYLELLLEDTTDIHKDWATILYRYHLKSTNPSQIWLVMNRLEKHRPTRYLLWSMDSMGSGFSDVEIYR